MKTRAALAVGANKPLEIHEVNLDGPKAGGVLVLVLHGKEAPAHRLAVESARRCRGAPSPEPTHSA